jgi:hypothetical protein
MEFLVSSQIFHMLRLTEIAIESCWTLVVFSSLTIRLLLFARL